jgi:hypothetical protein
VPVTVSAVAPASAGSTAGLSETTVGYAAVGQAGVVDPELVDDEQPSKKKQATRRAAAEERRT